MGWAYPNIRWCEELLRLRRKHDIMRNNPVAGLAEAARWRTLRRVCHDGFADGLFSTKERTDAQERTGLV